MVRDMFCASCLHLFKDIYCKDSSKKKKKKTLHSVVPVNFLRQFSCDVVLRKNFIDSKLGKKIAMTRWKIEMVHEKYQIPKSLWFNKILIHL